MKKLITITLLLFITSFSYGRGWFISNSGNDTTGNGTIGTPYRSIAKINTLWGSILSGDSICFFSGQKFYGAPRPNKSNLKFTTYGGSTRATVSGFSPAVNWVTGGGANLWIADALPGTNSGISMFTRDDVPLAMGRWPDYNVSTDGYALYDVGTPNVSIVSRTALPFNPTGATLCPRLIADILGRFDITSVSGNTINFTTLVGTQYPGFNGFGFFIENSLSTLTVNNEWFFNQPTRRPYLYSTTTPTNIKIATLDTLLFIGGNDNITVDNINFEGADKAAISFGGPTVGNSTNTRITNVDIINSGRDAIYSTNTNNTVIDHVNITNALNNGIVMMSEGGRSVNVSITNDTLNNIGYLPGMSYLNYAQGFKFAMEGITNGSNPVVGEIGMNIKFNKIYNVGHVGVRFYQNNTHVDSNFIKKFAFITDDCGGINTFGNFQTVAMSNRTSIRNIVDSGIGAPNGANGKAVVNGIYNDDLSKHWDIIGNSVGNITGSQFDGACLYVHNGTDITMRDNVLYNGGYAGISAVSDGNAATQQMTNLVVRNNLVFAKNNSSYYFITRTRFNDIATIYNRDSNRYCRPSLITSSTITGRIFNNVAGDQTTNYTFPSWRTAFPSYDINSTQMGTNPNASDFVYNAGNNDSTLNFSGLSYLVLTTTAPYQIVYNNSMPLKAHQGYVRIANGAAPVINKTPVANAGPNRTITLPQDSVHLQGMGSDSDGVVVSYAWDMVSGPNAPTINPFFTTGNGNTTITGLIGGIYQFRLTVTDNNGASNTSVMRVTVNIPPNVPPTANAGTDQSITLPTSTTTLTGTDNDPDGSIVSRVWTKVSGPTGGAITSPTSASTGITGLQQGTYAFQYTVTDNGGLTASDLVNIVVNPANIAPVANAGSDITITLPDSTVQLIGSGIDADGNIVTYLWTKISGPSGTVIDAPNDSSTLVSGFKAGTYVFRLTVTDNMGLTGSDFVQVMVNPAVPPINVPPTANAGVDQTITLPTSTATLTGSGADSDGSIVAFLWRKISGPTGGVITSATSATTGVTGLTAGQYVYQLRVTDNNGDTATDAMQITVNPANLLPNVSAGANQIITLPTSSTTLTATASDPDGTIVSYLWMKVSGPSGGAITSPSTASTGITGLTQGTYIYEIKVVDNSGDSALSSVQITVNPAPVLTAPTANASTNDSIVQLPQSTANLSGSGTNGTGTIVSHVWTVFSGPGGSSFDNANNYNVTVSGLVEGTYLFKLTVTDNNGLIGTALVQVVVRPIVQAGIKVLLGYDIRAN